MARYFNDHVIAYLILLIILIRSISVTLVTKLSSIIIENDNFLNIVLNRYKPDKSTVCTVKYSFKLKQQCNIILQFA